MVGEVVGRGYKGKGKIGNEKKRREIKNGGKGRLRGRETKRKWYLT